MFSPRILITDNIARAATLIALISLFLIFSSYGELKLTYDSHDFMAAGESWQTYLHGKNADGFSYLTRAPLLPAYLGFFENKVLAAWWLNLICYVTTLLLIIRIGRRLCLSGIFLYGPVILTAMTYPWLLNHFFLWGEPPFVVFILLLTLCMLEDRPVSLVIFLCLVLFLIRKAGIFFFLSATAWYAIQKDYKKSFLVLLFGTITFAGGQFLEHYYDSTSALSNIIPELHLYSRVHYADALSSWVLPRVIPVWIRILLIVVTLTVILLTFRVTWMEFIRKKEHQVLLTIASLYAGTLIAATGCSGYEDAERYLNVVLPLCMVLIFSFSKAILLQGGGRSKFFLALLVVWSIYPLGRTIYHLFEV